MEWNGMYGMERNGMEETVSEYVPHNKSYCTVFYITYICMYVLDRNVKI